MKKPTAVVPELIHDQVWRQAQGIISPRTIGQAQEDLATGKLQGRKPPVVAGGIREGEALPQLLEAMELGGLIRNEAITGLEHERIPIFDTLEVTGTATITTIVVQQITMIDLTVTNTAIFNGSIDVAGDALITGDVVAPTALLQEIIQSTTSATSDATPQATYPGAGFGATTSITGGNISGILQVTTGTSTAVGDVCRVTFGVPKINANYAVVLQAYSNAAASAVVKIDGVNTLGWEINAVTALTASTAYIWRYVCI